MCSRIIFSAPSLPVTAEKLRLRLRALISAENRTSVGSIFRREPHRVFVASSASINIYNANGQHAEHHCQRPAFQSIGVTAQIPIYQLVTPGGDTQVVPISNIVFRLSGR